MAEARPDRRPLRRDAARSRQAIVDAAEPLVAERGYGATLMGEIGSQKVSELLLQGALDAGGSVQP